MARNRSEIKKTKARAVHKPTGWSKLQRMVLKYKGRWQQEKSR